ncbi:hypothetical protein Q9R08_08395 [Microbacterium sp. QXD-8]|uniref:DUF2076 domain-containing protein n=1 Tax=Microbacterium psychrotolerans TaxID=3068321 RepID=A0ABU0Z089_9MICO|nr:hypothetical protein [Microbacterium sp. QXD-8]MDQ7877987.1 hypothetical protein [Microbacterium sp. QXD-8]
MGFLDRLFGDSDAERQAPPVPPNRYGTSAPGAPAPGAAAPGAQPPRSEDEIAIERYRYLLRTAPPETIEQVHAEAFGRLTEPQRQQVLAELSAGLPPYEQPRSSDPQTMARAATRAEYLNPGFMERTLGPQRQGPSFGSMLGSSILGTVVGYVIGSALVSSFLAPTFAYDQGYQDGAAADGGGDAGADTGGDGASADAGWGDSGSGWGGDTGGGWGGDAAGADAGGFGDFGF